MFNICTYLLAVSSFGMAELFLVITGSISAIEYPISALSSSSIFCLMKNGSIDSDGSRMDCILSLSS